MKLSVLCNFFQDLCHTGYAKHEVKVINENGVVISNDLIDIKVDDKNEAIMIKLKKEN